MKLPTADRDILKGLAREYVLEAYTRWKERGGQPRDEPNLTVSLIKDYLYRHGKCPRSFKFATRREQDGATRSILGSLVRAGELGSSIGEGLNGKEVRCYESPNL